MYDVRICTYYIFIDLDRNPSLTFSWNLSKTKLEPQKWCSKASISSRSFFVQFLWEALGGTLHNVVFQKGTSKTTIHVNLTDSIIYNHLYQSFKTTTTRVQYMNIIFYIHNSHIEIPSKQDIPPPKNKTHTDILLKSNPSPLQNIAQASVHP